MSINEELGIIEEFSFRADLREPELKFLFKMIDLGKRFDWIFMDRKGKPANPDFDEIKELIRNSNNHSFLKDPVKFIEDIDSGEIQIEYKYGNNQMADFIYSIEKNGQLRRAGFAGIINNFSIRRKNYNPLISILL